MYRFAGIVIVLLSFLALSVPEIPVVGDLIGVEVAHAQKKKRKTLFDLLFKRLKKPRKKVRQGNYYNPSGKKRPKKRVAKRKANTPAKPKVIVVKKAENAGKILVVGDFMAGGLAKGLESLYSGNPDFLVVNQTKANSGIVRDDVVDWQKRISELTEEVEPVAIVFLVGMNDRQQMRTDEGRLDKMSDPWKENYVKRARSIAQVAKNKGMPFVWMGLPPVRSKSMNADYLAFNEIYRAQTEYVGGSFVDVWDGFVDAEGKFVSAGPDIKGRIVRLRGSKGINMTRAGMAKLAFYADRELRRIGVVNDNSQFLSSLRDSRDGIGIASRPEYDPAKTGKTVVISLSRPSEGESGVLDGGADFLKAKGAEKSVSHQLVESGIVPEPKTGRIDADWGAPVKKADPKNDTKNGEKTSALEVKPEATVN